MNNIKQKSKKKLFIVVIVILIIAILVIGGVVLYNNFFTAEDPTPSKGVVGVISDGWDTGLEDKTAPPSQGIQIPGYGTAVMKAGDKSLHLSIGNPKSNKCGFYATLKLADGTVLYKSELLEPGYGLTEVPLSQTLSAGEYTAMVYYQCVTLDEEHSPLNSAESEFKLIVK
ncbi:MAG: hypothetical protein ACI4XH_04960 [Acutalibacteraceae bacterium]